MNVNPAWVASLSPKEAPSVEGVEAILEDLASAQETYLLANLLSQENEAIERIIGAYARLRNFDREELGEIFEELAIKKAAEITKTLPTKTPKLLSGWGIS